MYQLSREKIQRIAGKGTRNSGGGSGGSSGVSAGWVDENYLSKEFFNAMFRLHIITTVTITDEHGEPVGEPTHVPSMVLPNNIPQDTEVYDEETGYTTTSVVTIDSIEAKAGLWTDSYLSALGQNSSGGGGGASALYQLVDVKPDNDQTPSRVYGLNGTASDIGKVLMMGSDGKWYAGTVQSGSSAWSDITGKPTTLSGYGITDAYISNGTITLGSNSITPLTSITSSDVTNALGYTPLSGITSAMVTSALGYTPMSNGVTFWGQSVNNGAVNGSLSSVIDITMSGDIKMNTGTHIFSDNKNMLEYDGNQVTLGYGFRAAKPTQIYGTYIQMFAGSTEIVRITSDGLKIGNAYLTWDSTNNALKLTGANGAAINFYATGGVTALA